MPDSQNEIEILKAENELLKFKAESAERLAAHEKVIREVEGYKRFLQFTVAFLGLGSLTALLTLPSALNSLVDRQIAAQLQKWNDLDIGIGFVREARWGDALDKLKTVYEQEAKVPETKSNQDYRSLLNETLLFVLSSTGELMGDGRWQGDDEWNELLKDRMFRDQFLNISENKIDETSCNEMFFCTLKFSRDPDSLNLIRGYIQRALNIIVEDRSKAPHYFDLAMTDLVNGDQSSAKRNLQEASDKDPSNYQDTLKCINSFKNNVQFQMWRLCAERLHKDFDSAVTDLIDKIQPQSIQTH